jgi:site-specific DNA recombinase
MKVEDRARILKAIATGRGWLDELISGHVPSTDAIAARERCSERSVQRALSLAFLSPRIIEAIIDGKLPRGIGIASLASLPACFAKQHAGLGI